MPQILVVPGPLDPDASEALLAEHVEPELLASEHYAKQLIERMRWAVEDAEEVEHRAGRPERRPPAAG